MDAADPLGPAEAVDAPPAARDEAGAIARAGVGVGSAMSGGEAVAVGVAVGVGFAGAAV